MKKIYILLFPVLFFCKESFAGDNKATRRDLIANYTGATTVSTQLSETAL